MTDIFSPIELGAFKLANRIAMAPMTRSRAPNDIATDMVALYYTQRATAGLIITEGTPISREGQGYLFNPGMFTQDQIAGWRLTTQSVHSVGGRIFAQLWHVGRVSLWGHADITESLQQARPEAGGPIYTSATLLSIYDREGGGARCLPIGAGDHFGAVTSRLRATICP